MRNNLEFLIELIGQTEAESILQNHVKKNWITDKRQNEDTVKRTSKHRKFVLGARAWTNEDTERLKTRVQELKQDGQTNRYICKTLAPEFHRTPSSIFNRLYVLNIQ